MAFAPRSNAFSGLTLSTRTGATFCSRMYAAGIQPVLIELLMGHAGSGLIHTYAKADDDFKRDAAAKLEAFITSKSSAENTTTTSTTWVN